MTNKKKFEDMSATELLDKMNEISEYCSNKGIEEGRIGCRTCPLFEYCTAVYGDPSEWNTYDFITLVNTFNEEVE